MAKGYAHADATSSLIAKYIVLHLGGVWRRRTCRIPAALWRGHSCWLLKKDLVSLQTGFTQSGQLRVSCVEQRSLDWMCECTRSARAWGQTTGRRGPSEAEGPLLPAPPLSHLPGESLWPEVSFHSKPMKPLNPIL